MLVLMEQLEKKQKQTAATNADQKAKLEVLEKDLADLLLEKTKLEAVEGAAKQSADLAERRKKEEVEVMLEDVRRATEGQLETRQKRVDELEDQLSKASALTLDLQTKYDFLVKQQGHDQSAAEARIALAEKSVTHLRNDVEDLHQRRITLEKEVFEKSKEVALLQDKLQETAQAQSRNLQRSTEMKSELTSSLENFRQKLLATEDTRAAVEQQNDGLGKRVAALQKDLLAKEREYQSIIDDERRKAETEKQGLLNKMKALAVKSKAGEQRAIELLKVQEELRTRWQEELTYEKRALEEQVDKLKKQCLQLRMGAVLNKRGS
mmetsp:Transcript_26501/g.66818  ORF Transcript_26501/g.66818 Transcript_26501/m.66818 type:complete len:322 (-) Transcript_26501:97-1062(-)